MKKILLYGFLILLVFTLLKKLWSSITFDEEAEVSRFVQKVEMLESSDDNYDIYNSSNEYLNFLEENIDWFSPEQSKKISENLNSLRSSSKKKIDSIVQAKEREKEVKEAANKEEKDDEDTENVYETELEKKSKVLMINPDTEEGLMVYDTLRKMDYNQMVARFGRPTSFDDLSGTYSVFWSNIRIKKEGIDVWCALRFEYSNVTNHFVGYSISFCD